MLKCVPNLQISYSRHNLVFRSRKLYRMSTMYPPYGSSQFLLKHKDIRLSYNYFTLQKISLFCCLGCDFTKNPSNSIILGLGNSIIDWKGELCFTPYINAQRLLFMALVGEFTYYMIMCIFWKNGLNFSRTLYFLAR